MSVFLQKQRMGKTGINFWKEPNALPILLFFTSYGATLKNRNNATEKVEQRKAGDRQLLLLNNIGSWAEHEKLHIIKLEETDSIKRWCCRWQPMLIHKESSLYTLLRILYFKSLSLPSIRHCLQIFFVCFPDQ